MSDASANEMTQCEVCGEMTDHPILTADSHPIGPNEWVCGDCDSSEESDTETRRWSVGVRDVETHEWTEVVVSAADRDEAASKAKDQSRGPFGFNRQTALETDVEEVEL